MSFTSERKYSIMIYERILQFMNVEKQLQKDGIIIKEKINTAIILKIANNISNMFLLIHLPMLITS